MRLIVALLLSVGLARAELIPAARLTSWVPGVDVGIPGGIEQYRPGGASQRTTLINVTSAPYNADNTGATDATSAINAAIAAATSGQVVYLPAGTYRCNGGVDVGAKDNITIRGAGMNLTTIMSYTGGSSMGAGSNSDYAWTTDKQTITGSPARGTATLTISDATPYTVGGLAEVRVANFKTGTNLGDANRPVLHVSGFNPSRRQKVLIVSKTSNTVTVKPALLFDTSGYLTTISRAQLQSEFVGFEDFTLDCTNTSSTDTGMFWEQTVYCWLYNVKVKNHHNYNIKIYDSFGPEVRRSWSEIRNGTGSNGGALVFDAVGCALVEDNILRMNFPLLEVNASTMNSVFAYNFGTDSYSGQGSFPYGLNSNHNPHNSFNLYEGNIAPAIQADGFYGSVSDDTIFRNYFGGVSFSEGQGLCLNFNRFTRNYSAVGNVLGSNDRTSYPIPSGGIHWGMPNIGNFSWTGEAQASVGDWWSELPGGVYPAEGPAWPGSAGFQELDLDVETTLVFKGNYDTESDTMGSLGGDLLPNSLFRSAKPTWFGNLTWPPIDPANPGTPVWNNANFVKIPAGYRYVNGVDPPPDGGGGGPGGSTGGKKIGAPRALRAVRP